MLWYLIVTIDVLLFVFVALTTLYMAIYSIASLFSRHVNVPTAKLQNRFIILIPSYRQDDAIEKTVRSILGQTYPQRLFDVTVISDHQ
ncbi:MAG: glycosyltransferase family 2 protein, partial [Prevotella sp.]